MHPKSFWFRFGYQATLPWRGSWDDLARLSFSERVAKLEEVVVNSLLKWAEDTAPHKSNQIYYLGSGSKQIIGTLEEAWGQSKRMGKAG